MAVEQSEQYVFLVDDEPIQNEMTKDHISSIFRYKIKTFENGEDAINGLGLNPCIVVLDYHLNSHLPNAQNGVDVLKKIKELNPATEVIMLSGQDKIEVAVDSMKYGAYDYVIKGETAFTRIENIFNKINELQRHIYELSSMKSANKTYKKIIIALFILLGLTLVLSVFMVNKLDVSMPTK